MHSAEVPQKVTDVQFSHVLRPLTMTTRFELSQLLRTNQPGSLQLSDLSNQAAEDIELNLGGLPTTFEIRDTTKALMNREAWSTGNNREFATLAVGKGLEAANVILRITSTNPDIVFPNFKVEKDAGQRLLLARYIVDRLAESEFGTDWPKILASNLDFSEYVLPEGCIATHVSHTSVPAFNVVAGANDGALFKISDFLASDSPRHLIMTRDAI